jgi:hypothetical protein
MVSLWRPELPGAETLASGAASAAAGTLCFGLPDAFVKRCDSEASSGACATAGWAAGALCGSVAAGASSCLA